MIVVDTSAIIAIFRQEDDATAYALCIGEDDQPAISAATLLETSLVVRGFKSIEPDRAEQWLSEFLNVSGISVIAFTPDQAEIARAAHIRFGKGSGHRAGLNYGDCFAYALAKTMNSPLLFKGEDFARTDIAPALPKRSRSF